MILIKDEEVLREVLANYHPVLVDIVCFIYAVEGKIFITSAYRKGDTGVHGFWRGIDLRSWIYSNPDWIVRAVNRRWEYDPKRPDKECAILHKTKKGAMHLHFQVHPNTVKEVV